MNGYSTRTPNRRLPSGFVRADLPPGHRCPSAEARGGVKRHRKRCKSLDPDVPSPWPTPLEADAPRSYAFEELARLANLRTTPAAEGEPGLPTQNSEEPLNAATQVPPAAQRDHERDG